MRKKTADELSEKIFGQHRRRGTRRREMTVRAARLRVEEALHKARMHERLSTAEVMWLLSDMLQHEARRVCQDIWTEADALERRPTLKKG